MNSLLVLVDESNLVNTFRRSGKRCDWQALREYLVNVHPNRQLVEMVLFSGLPPKTDMYRVARRGREEFIYSIRREGFMVIERDSTPTPTGYKSNVDVMMAIEGMELAYEMKPDIVMLVTADGDFSYMATALRRKGIRVEVATVREAISATLLVSANEFIDLTDMINEFPEWEVRNNYPD